MTSMPAMTVFFIIFQKRIGCYMEPENDGFQKESPNLHLQWLIFRFHVKLQGCISNDHCSNCTRTLRPSHMSRGMALMNSGGMFFAKQKITEALVQKNPPPNACPFRFPYYIPPWEKDDFCSSTQSRAGFLGSGYVASSLDFAE